MIEVIKGDVMGSSVLQGCGDRPRMNSNNPLDSDQIPKKQMNKRISLIEICRNDFKQSNFNVHQHVKGSCPVNNSVGGNLGQEEGWS